jgi:hypothetical protein
MTLPRSVQTAVRGGIVVLLLGLGIFWGATYKRIYLDPWPTDDRYHSVFMRMTASHLKPFEVCDFINDNDLRGRVFNYWTEGGAVAFGQTPDPDTGEIPLKLFMDGRAQAAYNHDKFQLWQQIHSGGPAIQQARLKGENTPDVLTASGEWIDEQLKERAVWVALMPQTQSNSTFMQALKRTDNWKTAYVDNTQQLLVDTETPQGQALIDRILDGTAVFPEPFSKNLTTATVIIETQRRERMKDLYDLLAAAFQEHPYPIAAYTLTRLAGTPVFRSQVADLFQSYLEDLKEEAKAYRKTDGYGLRLNSARIAARFLAGVHPDQREAYLNQAEQFQEELERINHGGIW